MSASHTSLEAAATDRKARLARLTSLKRKQPGSDTIVSIPENDEASTLPLSKTNTYLSGRNYDVTTKGPRLGFENTPSAEVQTLEQKAEQIAASVAEQATKDESEAEKGIDLFKLQPKKPNWDLKRDLAEKMKVLDVRTQNAIARLVRERIENAKKHAQVKEKGKSTQEGEEHGEEVGMEGTTLVEGIHLREKEEQEEERREKELEAEEEAS